MAFIAAPSDDEFRLELDILNERLEDKEYESYIAVQRLDPAKYSFCTKICSKIITSQFCMVLLNSSTHGEHNEIKIPNPNVHLEYGMMMAFSKYIIPLQKECDNLAFNIQPLDTVIYTKANFKEKADRVIDAAILAVGTTVRPSPAITANESLSKYLAVRGLQLTDISSPDANTIYRLGSPLGFSLLDGQEVIYFGVFDKESPKEIVFRLKLLLQNLHQAREIYENITSKSQPPEEIERIRYLWSRIKAEVLVSKEIDIKKVESKVRELTIGLNTIPWVILTENDINVRINDEYNAIGEL